MTAVEDGPTRRTFRPATILLWVLAAAVAATVATGAVVGAVREPDTIDPVEPEGVVQAYLQAALDGDYADAVGYLSAETAERCHTRDFRNAWIPESLTATLDDVRPRGDEVEVRVRLRSVGGPPPFGGGEYSSTETFVLVQEDGGWRLTDSPWPVFCGPARPIPEPR